jgi:dsDNA-specific endonuclease/ATPase MutS2
MKFENIICGKSFKYERPAELIEQIRPHMLKAEAEYKALDQKAEETYRKSKEEADKIRKIYYVFRKAIEQLGGSPTAASPTKPEPAPDSKSNAS